MTYTAAEMRLLRLSDQVDALPALRGGNRTGGRPRISLTPAQRRLALEYSAAGLSCTRIAPLLGLTARVLARELPDIVRPYRPAPSNPDRPRRRHP